MIDRAYLDVLRTLYARLSGTGVVWVVTGSLGFALQGVPVTPHDIDLQTDAGGAYAIARLFAEYAVRPVAFSSAATIRSHFGALAIAGISVEIMGDIQKRLPDGNWDDLVDLERHRRVVEVAGMQLPVLSLDYEREAYVQLGRTETATMLEEWLRGQD
jgi:hypothetical protein